MGPTELSTLMERHAAALVLFARQWCACPEDVVQEAFVKLSRTTLSLSESAPWLYRVVRNGAISTARSEGRRRRREQKVARPDAWFAPREGYLDTEEATTALKELPREQREVVIAHLWSGLTFAEIGEVIGASSSTAHRLYQSGLQALRERLLPCPRTTTVN